MERLKQELYKEREQREKLEAQMQNLIKENKQLRLATSTQNSPRKSNHHDIISNKYSENECFEQNIEKIKIKGGGRKRGDRDDEDELLDKLENSFRRFSSILDNLERGKSLM